jgi:fructose-bisphosphate aldolase class II
MAEHYGVPVLLHSDHCAKKLLPWFDGMLEADEKHFKEHGTPLFSSHMLDLSEEPHAENIEICAKYLERMAKIDCLLEMEIGITGGEEDGVNNENVNPKDLYSKPEEVMQVVEAFNKVPNAMYTIAAAFGNVHGVYKAGNVKLSPEILGDAQAYIKKELNSKEDKPVFFVFHGGSGSEKVPFLSILSQGYLLASQRYLLSFASPCTIPRSPCMRACARTCARSAMRLDSLASWQTKSSRLVVSLCPLVEERQTDSDPSVYRPPPIR